MHQYSPKRWPSPKAGNEVASPTVYREAEMISTSLARAGSRAWAHRTTCHEVCCVIYVHKNFYNRNVFFPLLSLSSLSERTVTRQNCLCFPTVLSPPVFHCCSHTHSSLSFPAVLQPPIFAPLLSLAKTTWKIHIAEGEIGMSECFLLSLELPIFLQHTFTFELLF